MKGSRRRFLRFAAGAAALPALPRMARAQAYPNRAVRIIVAYAAGATNDTLARLIGQWLSERLGQTFVIENRPGAGTNLATEAVVRAPADGYTLLLTGPANATNATLYERLSFNFLRDIVPVAGFVRVPQVIVVHPSLPVTTVPQLIAYAKANPGRINMASAGNGSSLHLAGELFKLMAGVDLLHVPYRGGAPMYTDLLAGQTQVMFGVMTTSITYIRAGKLRALGVTTAARLDVLPDVPTVAEFVPGYEASSPYGLGAPKDTPADIVDRLNREVNLGLADPRLKARLADMGGIPLAGSPADYGRLLIDETEKWGKVVKFAGVKAD
jgi:tripartite-type tricarboxylate transporter receptor subunit TctC